MDASSIKFINQIYQGKARRDSHNHNTKIDSDIPVKQMYARKKSNCL